MITFELFCEDERKFTPHRIEEAGNIQTITCLSCNYIRTDAIIRRIGMNMNLKKQIWEAFLNERGAGKRKN